MEHEKASLSTPATVPMDVDLRPSPQLLIYYAFTSFLLGPLFLATLIPLFFRYKTLRYRFDEEGVSMAWGALFRREVHLTYARIQDIHLTSNAVERWLGLARVQVQTASGSAKAEMTISGRLDYVLLRDFLYRRMRGTQDPDTAAGETAGGARATTTAADEDLATVLLAVAAELRQLRQLVAAHAEPASGAEVAGAAAGDATSGDPLTLKTLPAGNREAGG